MQLAKPGKAALAGLLDTRHAAWFSRGSLPKSVPHPYYPLTQLAVLES